MSPYRLRAGRATELALLVPALLLGIGGHALVGLARDGELPPGLPRLAVTLGGLAIGMHAVLRWRAPYADPVVLPVAVALNGIGLAMIHRLDPEAGQRQIVWTALAVVLATLVLVVLRDHRTLRRYTYTAMVAGLLLVALPLVPGLGVEIFGARIWIRVAGFSFQPAELGKIVLAVFFAGYLVTTRDTLALAGPRVLGLQLPRPRDLGPILLAWAGALAILVLQRDLGTSLLFFGLFVAMLYLATERVSWVVIGLGLFLAGAAVAASAFAHVGQRFDAWIDAFDNDVYNRSPGGSGQLVQGLFGLANGGLFGTGWGQGRPDLVPLAESDFIVAALGEELGLTGLLAILMCYLIIAQRGMRTAIGVRDGFGKLFAGGITFVVAFQCFVVVGGVTRLVPLTGLTMPFLAAGGSSLLANWVIVALLLRISDAARRPAGEPAPVPARASEEVRTPSSDRSPERDTSGSSPTAQTERIDLDPGQGR